VLSGDESINYEILLDSLEEEYGLEGISEYDNPEEVRIDYHISGAGSKWEKIIRVEIDEKRNIMEILPNFQLIREKLEGSSVKNLFSTNMDYTVSEETHVRTYHNHEIPIQEMNEFLDEFPKKQ
jgi:hypothetical protein